MTLFATTDVAYTAAEDASVYVMNCEPGPIMRIGRAHTKLRQLVRDGDEDLAAVAELLRFARYRLATNILPPAHVELGLADLAHELAAHLTQMHAGTPSHTAAFRGHEAIMDLLDQERSTLATAALELLEDAPAHGRTLALVHSRNVSSTAAYLDECGLPTTVISQSDLRSQPPNSVTICIGPHQFFPAAVWSASRSDSVCFVQYPDSGGPPASGGLFGADGGLATPKFRVSGASEPVEDIEPIDLNEGLVVAAEREIARRSNAKSDSVEEGVLLLLEGGYAVWTGVADGQRMWAIDFTESDHPVMVSLNVNNIGPDSYVIFRDQGARSELVEEVANTEHGVSKFRPAQQRWKSELLNAIFEAGGFGAAGRELRMMGAETTNLAHWVSRYSIRPNRRADFDAVCRFAGLADESAELWAAVSAINRAHLKAGYTIRKWLEQSLMAGGAEQLKADGYQTLELSFSGTLSAFRVVHKHPDTRLIDVALIDKPFLMEARGWHG